MSERKSSIETSPVITILPSGDIRISLSIFDKIPRSDIGKIIANFINGILGNLAQSRANSNYIILSKDFVFGAMKELLDILVGSQNKRHPFRFKDEEKENIKDLIRDILIENDMFRM